MGSSSARAWVRLFLVFPLLMACITFVGAVVAAIPLAGSTVNAVVAFTLLPLATWMGWRMAVVSPAFSRWLTRCTVALAGVSMCGAVLATFWPVLVAVATGAGTAGVGKAALLSDLSGAGICVSAMMLCVVVATALWPGSQHEPG